MERPAWAEALLSADLSLQERKSWAKRLAKWQEGLDDYGVDDAFAIATAAAFKKTLHKALTSKGVHIIDIPVDYSENKLLGK